jgi:hypothetical protein
MRDTNRQAEIEELRRQLEESRETLRAIRAGEVDALVVSGPNGDQVYVLKGADQRYRNFVETMNEGAVTLLRNGTITFSNDRFARMLGAPLEQVIGAPLASFLPPGQRHRLQSLLDEAAGRRGNAVLSFLTSAGATMQTELSMCPVTLDGLAGVCVVVNDITERRKTEELRAYLASIVDSTDDAIIGVDLNGTIVSWNPGARKLYGYGVGEALGRPLTGLAPPERTEEVLADLAKAARGEAVEPFEAERVRKGGQRVWVSVTVSPVHDDEGNIVGVSTINHDITARKRAEEALARQKAELERSNAELQQFAYVASHDLQEPLRAVASFTKLLAERYRGRLDRDADDFIDFAVDGAKRAQRLIADLLAYSRVGTRGAAFAPTDCEAVLDNALANLAAALEETRGQVTHEPVPMIDADEVQIGQLLQNLIGNALKFHGSEPPRVHVSARQITGAWQFSVSDNGIGIAPEYAETIFEVFQRLHTSAEYPGTGIGLAIAKKIVGRHEGRIWVESQPGKGATFFFTIPFQKGGGDAG